MASWKIPAIDNFIKFPSPLRVQNSVSSHVWFGIAISSILELSYTLNPPLRYKQRAKVRIQVHELSREERLLELHAPPLELQDIGNVTDLQSRSRGSCWFSFETWVFFWNFYGRIIPGRVIK